MQENWLVMRIGSRDQNRSQRYFTLNSMFKKLTVKVKTSRMKESLIPYILKSAIFPRL
jgi:hypothetical protein